MELVAAMIEDGGGGSNHSANHSAPTMLAFNTQHFGELRTDIRSQEQLQQHLRLQHQKQRERLHSDGDTNHNSSNNNNNSNNNNSNNNNNNNSNNNNNNNHQHLHLTQEHHVRTHSHLQHIRQAIQLQQLQQQTTVQQQYQQQQQQQQQHQQQSPHQQYATSSSPLQGTIANMPDSPNTPGSSCAKEEDKNDDWQPYPESAFLGPQLWDKTVPYESQTQTIKPTPGSRQRPDIKLSESLDSHGGSSIPSPSPPTSPNPRTFSDAMLEYMDLDDFLNENNLHMNSNGGSRSNSSNNSGSSVESSSKVSEARSPVQAEAPASPRPTSAMMGTGLGACMREAMGASHPATQNMGMCSPPVMSPNDLMSPLSPASPADRSTMINGDYQGELQHPELRQGPKFDPRTHCFSEDELKPQPIVKKSRKQFVPCDLKDDRYWDRRNKNNAAAKRSRDARRMKENQIAMRASFLEKENHALTIEVEQANAMVESLKKRLSMYEAV